MTAAIVFGFEGDTSAVWCGKTTLPLKLPAINLTWLQPWIFSIAFNAKRQNTAAGSADVSSAASLREAFLWIRWHKGTHERLNDGQATAWTWVRHESNSLQHWLNLCEHHVKSKFTVSRFAEAQRLHQSLRHRAEIFSNASYAQPRKSQNPRLYSVWRTLAQLIELDLDEKHLYGFGYFLESFNLIISTRVQMFRAGFIFNLIFKWPWK